MELSDAKILDAVLAQLEEEANNAPPPPKADDDDVTGDAWEAGAPGTQWSLPGLAPMTRVSTSFGEVYAHALRKRDLVRTHTGEFLPIVWIDRINLETELLSGFPDAQPVLIQPGAFGKNIPEGNVCVSPAQMVVPTRNGPGADQRSARSLLEHPGVVRHTDTTITYTRFLLPRPALVRSEGIWLAISP